VLCAYAHFTDTEVTLTVHFVAVVILGSYSSFLRHDSLLAMQSAVLTIANLPACLPVCHRLTLCLNNRSWDHADFTRRQPKQAPQAKRQREWDRGKLRFSAFPWAYLQNDGRLRAPLITNRKSHTVFRFLTKLMTLYDPKPQLRVIYRNVFFVRSQLCLIDCDETHRPYYQRQMYPWEPIFGDI